MDFLSINGHEIKWCLHCWNSAFTRWIWFEREREFIWFFNKVNTICKRVALCKCETLFSIARCEIQKNSRTKEGWKSYTNIHFYFASISSFAKQKRGWKQNERKKRKKMAKIHIPARLRLWCTTSVRLQSHCWLVGSLRCDAGFHFEELMGDVERENGEWTRWTRNADHPPRSFITGSWTHVNAPWLSLRAFHRSSAPRFVDGEFRSLVSSATTYTRGNTDAR